MADHQCSIAHVQSFIKDLPEKIHILARGACDINKVNRNNPLVESAIVLMLSIDMIQSMFIVIPSVFCKSVWSEEGTAAHAWIYITFEFLHDLCGDIVRNHSLSGAFCSKLCQIVIFGIFMNVVFIQSIDELRKCWCNINTLFILDTDHSLLEHFLNDQSQVISCSAFFHFIQVHEYSDKRGLSVCCHQSDDLILDCLYTSHDFTSDSFFRNTIDLFLADIHSGSFHFFCDSLSVLLTADIYKWSKMGECDCLTAILVGSNLCNDLCCDITCSCEAVWFVDLCTGNDSSILQHVFQIDQTAVIHRLCKVVCIMEVDDALFMCIPDICR